MLGMIDFYHTIELMDSSVTHSSTAFSFYSHRPAVAVSLETQCITGPHGKTDKPLTQLESPIDLTEGRDPSKNIQTQSHLANPGIKPRNFYV